MREARRRASGVLARAAVRWCVPRAVVRLSGNVSFIKLCQRVPLLYTRHGRRGSRRQRSGLERGRDVIAVDGVEKAAAGEADLLSQANSGGIRNFPVGQAYGEARGDEQEPREGRKNHRDVTM
jgi:hypothetical protein